MDSGGFRFSSHASSSLAAVSVVLILLYLCWRFIWQIKKDATSTTGAAAASPSSPCATLRETSHPLPLFVRVEVAAAAAGGGVEKADCAVCLEELGDGEAAARFVPGCGHGFHVECIEAWLRVNSTCPLCRAAVAARGHKAPEAIRSAINSA